MYTEEHVEALRLIQHALAIGSTEVSLCGFQLESLPRELASLTRLQYLDLSRCTQLMDLSPLAALTSLRHLNLSECDQLQDFSPLAYLTGLQRLELGGCSKLQDLSPLVGLTE